MTGRKITGGLHSDTRGVVQVAHQGRNVVTIVYGILVPAREPGDGIGTAHPRKGDTSR